MPEFNLEASLVLRDELSAPLVQVGQQVQTAGQGLEQVGAQSERSAKRFELFGESAHVVGRALARSGLGLAAGLEAVTLMMDNSTSAIDKGATAMSSLGFAAMALPGPFALLGVALEGGAGLLHIFGAAAKDAEAQTKALGIAVDDPLTKRLKELQGQLDVINKPNLWQGLVQGLKDTVSFYMGQDVQAQKVNAQVKIQIEQEYLLAHALQEANKARAETIKPEWETDKQREADATKRLADETKRLTELMKEDTKAALDDIAAGIANQAAQARLAEATQREQEAAVKSLGTLSQLEQAIELLTKQGYGPLASSVAQYAAALRGDQMKAEQEMADKLGLTLTSYHQLQYAILETASEAKRAAEERVAAEEYANRSLQALWQSQLATQRQLDDQARRAAENVFRAQQAAYDAAHGGGAAPYLGEKRPQYLMEQMWSQGATPVALIERFGGLAQQYLANTVYAGKGGEHMSGYVAPASATSHTLTVNIQGGQYGTLAPEAVDQLMQAIRTQLLVGGFNKILVMPGSGSNVAVP